MNITNEGVSVKDLKDAIKSFDNPFSVKFTNHFIERASQRKLSTNQAIEFFKILAKPENRQKLKDALSKSNHIVLKKDSLNIPIVVGGGDSMKAKSFIRSKKYKAPKGQVNVSLTEKIVKVDDGWAVYPKRGGDRLGTHPTKDAALKQLAAIEISKQKRKKVKETFYKTFEGMTKDRKLSVLESILSHL
jgi:hypothetical protein